MEPINTPDAPTFDPHPVAGRPMLLPRIGSRQQKVIPQLRDLGISTFVEFIYYAREIIQAPLDITASPIGRVLDPCTHILQQPLSARAPSFRELSYGSSSTAYRPDKSRPSEKTLQGLISDPLDAQRSKGADLLLTTYHVAGKVGSRGRAIELLLARGGVELFRQQGMSEPASRSGFSRKIYATIAVKAIDLASPEARVALADSYLDIPADGYWVKILGLNEKSSPEQIAGCGAFFALLQDGGKPVVACGPGQLYLGFLANDFSASIGLGEHEQFRLPSDWRKRKPGTGRRRRAYHPKYLHSYWVKSEEAKRAFANAPCTCGHHEATEPPNGKSVVPHAASTRALEARDACEGEIVSRREWIVANATRASWVGNDADVQHTSASKFQALFSGFDRDDRLDIDLPSRGSQDPS